MRNGRNSIAARWIPPAIALLLLPGVLSCRHRAKQGAGPSQVHVGNLLEVNASPGILTVQAQVGDLEFFMPSPAFTWESRTVALVPLVPVGTKLTFDPSSATARTVEVVESPSSNTPPGTATLALLDTLGGLSSKLSGGDANTLATLELLTSAAAGLRDEVMIAQSSSVALGNFGGKPLVLDASALTALDAAIAGSLEPVVPLQAAVSDATLGARRDGATRSLASSGNPVPIFGFVAASLFIFGGTALEAGVLVAGYILVSAAGAALVTSLALDAMLGSSAASDALVQSEMNALKTAGETLGSFPSVMADLARQVLADGADGALANSVTQLLQNIFNCNPACGPGFACMKGGCVCEAWSCFGLQYCTIDGRCLGLEGAGCSSNAACGTGDCLNGLCVKPGTGGGGGGCTPDCLNRECGPDSCGGQNPGCGTCPLSGVACANGHCCPTSGPAYGLGCPCPNGSKCVSGSCCTPTPGACQGRTCGSDGCDPNGCGPACAGGAQCISGTCCTPQCAGHECGADSCGGNSCGSGTCSSGSCINGVCVCTPSCKAGTCYAGSDGCGGTCACPSGFACSGGACSCTGNDGPCDCGSTTCAAGENCVNGVCQSCGGTDQSCCGGNACLDSSLTCVNGICTQKTCAVTCCCLGICTTPKGFPLPTGKSCSDCVALANPGCSCGPCCTLDSCN